MSRFILMILSLSSATAVSMDSAAGESVAVTNSLGMVFRLIPAGKFLMGSPDGEEGRDGNERQHQVTISNSFFLAILEVTHGQWRQVMEEDITSRKDSLPVSMVSFHDALRFCGLLSGTEGQGRRYRLPTEAEWEYACRAGSTSSFGGSGNLAEMGWTFADFAELTQQEDAAVANEFACVGGGKSANAWGLYDMHGNLKEWTSDDTFKTGAKPDPMKPSSYYTGSTKVKCRIVRGGSLVSKARYCRSAFRDWEPEDSVSTDLGFRVVLELPEAAHLER